MSVIVIRCRRSYHKEQSQRKTLRSWKDNIKEWTSQSMSSLLHIADDRGRWAASTPNDAWALRVLVCVTKSSWLAVLNWEVKMSKWCPWPWPWKWGQSAEVTEFQLAMSRRRTEMFGVLRFRTCNTENWLRPFHLEIWQNAKNALIGISRWASLRHIKMQFELLQTVADGTCWPFSWWRHLEA